MAGSTPFESEKKTQSVQQVYLVPSSCLSCRCIWESNDPAHARKLINSARKGFVMMEDRTSQSNCRTVRWRLAKDYRRAGFGNILNLG